MWPSICIYMHYLHYFGDADKLQWTLYASLKVLVTHLLQAFDSKQNCSAVLIVHEKRSLQRLCAMKPAHHGSSCNNITSQRPLPFFINAPLQRCNMARKTGA